MAKCIFRRLLGIKLGVLHQHVPQSLHFKDEAIIARDVANLPIISLVTPSFNQGIYIHKTIESVLNQKYPHLEYLIQDACSTDSTSAVLSAFPPDKFEYFIEPDKGQADAINLGFSRSNGEIMAWLNSDDLLLPGALGLVGEFFLSHPEVDVVYGNRILIDNEGKQIGRWILPGHDADILRGIDYIPQETLFWRRRVWERAGGYVDDELNFALDWDLLLRFSDIGAKFVHLPLLFGAFRVHENQKTSALFVSSGLAESRLLRTRYGGNLLLRILRVFKHMIFLVKHKITDKQFD